MWSTLLSLVGVVLLGAGTGAAGLILAVAVSARFVEGPVLWWAPLFVVYPVAGLLGGALAGACGAGLRILRSLETMVRSQLTTRWLVPDEANRFNISLAHLRAGYDAWLEATTVDLFRPISLPRPLRSLVRWRLRQAVIGDFLVACEREGLTQLSAATLRDWLIDQGVAVMMAPLYQQLQLYRMVTIGVLVLLAAAPFAGIALAQSGVPFPGLGFRS